MEFSTERGRIGKALVITHISSFRVWRNKCQWTFADTLLSTPVTDSSYINDAAQSREIVHTCVQFMSTHGTPSLELGTSKFAQRDLSVWLRIKKALSWMGTYILWTNLNYQCKECGLYTILTLTDCWTFIDLDPIMHFTLYIHYKYVTGILIIEFTD